MRTAAAIARLHNEQAFEVLARAKALAGEGRRILNLGIGQPDFPTPPHIVEAAVRALRDGHHGYTEATGIMPLREAVAADLHARRGLDVDPQRIVIVPGGKMTIAFAIMLLGEPGAEILYPDPGFPIYRSMIAYSGAVPVPIRLHEERGFSFDADEVLAAIGPRTRLLIINSPANPTGGVVPRTALERLARGLAEHPHVAVLSDEIYARITFDDAPFTSLAAFPELNDRLILLDGWSKTYAMTGWRIGYGVWPASLVEAVMRLCVNTHSCVNAPTQWAAKAALEGPQDAVEAMVATFAKRRDRLIAMLDELPGVSCVSPGGAFYAFPNIKGTRHGAGALQRGLLEERGLAVIAGTSFGAHGEGYLRFSYAASLEAIEEACALFCDHLMGRTRKAAAASP